MFSNNLFLHKLISQSRLKEEEIDTIEFKKESSVDAKYESNRDGEIFYSNFYHHDYKSINESAKKIKRLN